MYYKLTVGPSVFVINLMRLNPSRRELYNQPALSTYSFKLCVNIRVCVICMYTCMHEVECNK